MASLGRLSGGGGGRSHASRGGPLVDIDEPTLEAFKALVVEGVAVADLQDRKVEGEDKSPDITLMSPKLIGDGFQAEDADGDLLSSV